MENSQKFNYTYSAKEQEEIKQEIHEQKVQSYKERIEALTEKFQNDPVKLGVLASLAKELNIVEE